MTSSGSATSAEEPVSALSIEAEPLPRWATYACYGLLLMLVWGATAWWQGLWQDDASLLAVAQRRAYSGLSHWFEPTANTRYLLLVPHLIAYFTGHPVHALQIESGLVWLALALAVGWVARELTASWATGFSATCLTLTASSDYLTDSIVAIGYNVAALSCVLAVGFGLAWYRRGSWRCLLSSIALLAASLATVEAAIPLLPGLCAIFAVGGRAPRSRRLALLGGWAIVALPFVLALWRFVHDAQGYAAGALVSLSWRGRVGAALESWLLNFTPWSWGPGRPAWYARPPHVIPGWVSVAGFLVAAALFGWMVIRAWRGTLGDRKPSARNLLVAVLCLLTAFCANAAYVGVQLSQINFRTHLFSRLFSSLAIALFVGFAIQRWRRTRILVVIPIAFVGFGVCGGLERQDLFLSTWRQHQTELLSIAEAMPGLPPGAVVLLRSAREDSAYRATAVGYLAGSWINLLYEDWGIRGHKLLPGLPSGCRPEANAVRCWREGQAGCVADGTCTGECYGYGQLIVLDFDAASGRYRLVPSLAGDPLGKSEAARAYQPRSLIMDRPLSRWQRRLLLQ